MRPSSGFNKPAIARSKVLFPAPEGPDITVIPVHLVESERSIWNLESGMYVLFENLNIRYLKS